MTFHNISIIIPFLYYILTLIIFFIGLLKLKTKNNNNNYSISIIVSAKDEEEDIEKLIKSLLKQSIKVEIIIINDRSSDNTLKILKKYNDIKIINIKQLPKGVSPKKHALSKGIKISNGELILLTDADCVVGKNWAKSMQSKFNKKVGVVAGLSELKEYNFVHKLMNLEMYALSICTAGAIGLNFPAIATGNNLSYKKSIYKKVNGFKNIIKIDSGDDDLLIQKIGKKTNTDFRFNTDPDSFVVTEPVKSIKEFINQRRRWASRGLDYTLSIKISLVLIYLFYLEILLMPFLLFFFPAAGFLLLKIFGISVVFEILLLFFGLKKINRLKYLLYYPLVKLFHIPYVVFMPLLGIFRGFKWK